MLNCIHKTEASDFYGTMSDAPIASMPTALREANLSEPLAGVWEGWWRTPTGAGLVAGEGVCACSLG